ncbi:hypothetical protein [Blastopirellula marina]|uniref:hypothetical protein n=1 Tax=Blastopirellula marina TaxID=124 RepID=UPI00032394EB|nr:hypothetical protein [Blastopirellula marina]
MIDINFHPNDDRGIAETIAIGTRVGGGFVMGNVPRWFRFGGAMVATRMRRAAIYRLLTLIRRCLLDRSLHLRTISLDTAKQRAENDPEGNQQCDEVAHAGR